MDYRIKTMSIYGDDILNKNVYGTVHSVYRKTVNLSLDGCLIALQPDGSLMSPVSLLLHVPENEFECLGLEAGIRVLVTKEAVEIEADKFSDEPLRFLRRGADRVNLKLTEALDLSRILEITEELEGTLGRQWVNRWSQTEKDAGNLPGNLLGGGSVPYPITEVAKKWVRKAGTQVKGGEWNGAADSLCRLIGLGIGLTPGGDDFLCGVLAGMILGDIWSHPFADALRNTIAAGIDRTNDISRMFLNCAREGQFGPAVHAFYEKPEETILDGMRQIGHTSGIDTLQGILYAFRLRKELKPVEMYREQITGNRR